MFMLSRLSGTASSRKCTFVPALTIPTILCAFGMGIMCGKHNYSHYTHNHLMAFDQDNPGRPVPEETLTHSHWSWSSDILCHFPPFTTINGILFVHFTCLTVLSDNLSPGPLWSSSWFWTLNFILHTFLHPIIIFFLQHMPIPTQPVLLQYQCIMYSHYSMPISVTSNLMLIVFIIK